MALHLVHRARVPPGPPDSRWPAVVMVHGWLGNENVMSIFERTVPPGIAVISPRAPLEVGPDGYGWYTRDEDPQSFMQGLAALAGFVRALPEAYPVQTDHIVLMGFSQGAAMCCSLLLSEPALVSAVAGLAGFLPERAAQWVAPGRLTSKEALILAGTEDATVPVALARDAAEALRLAGATVDLREYPVGHKLNADGMRDLREWLKYALELA